MKSLGQCLMMVAALSVFGPTVLSAADIAWDGGAGTLNIADAANWVGDVVPGAGDMAVFNGAVVPGGPLVWNGGTFANAILVDNSAASTLSITIALAGTMLFTGAGGVSIEIGENDTLAFTASSAGRTVIAEADVNIAGGATLSLNNNCILGLNAHSEKMTISDGATYLNSGITRATSNYLIDADNSGGGTVVEFGTIEVIGGRTLIMTNIGSGTIDATVINMVASTGNNSEVYFGGRWDIEVSGGFNAQTFENFQIDASDSFFAFPNASAFSFSGSGYFGQCSFGRITIDAGASLTVPANAFDNHPLNIGQLFVDGDFTCNIITLNFWGHIDAIDADIINIDPAGSYNQSSGNVNFPSGEMTNNWIVGEVTFGGDVTVNLSGGGALIVALGSTVTFEGDLHVINGSVGADEDGATASGAAAINYNGNVRVDVTNSLQLGEGVHTFAGNLDLGATSGFAEVVGPPTMDDNDEFPEIHLTGTTQTIAFGGTGSLFLVTSMGANTRVTQTGPMILVHANFSGATGTAGTLCWDGTGAVKLGDGLLEVTPNMTNPIGRVILGGLDVIFGATEMRQFGSPASATEGVHYIFSATGAGVLTIGGALTVRGDTSDDFAGVESNGGRLDVNDLTLIVNGDIFVLDGDDGGRGARLKIENSDARAANVNVGMNFATTNDEGPTAEIINSTFTVGAAGQFFVGNRGYFALQESTLAAASGAAYSLALEANTRGALFSDSTITGHAAHNITIQLGSADLTVNDCLFEHYNADGVTFALGSTVTSMNSNRFRNGVDPGSHINLNGLGNATKLNCDFNQFDDSTGTGSSAFINIIGGDNRLNFRAPTSQGFGIAPLVIDAAAAEARDTDGTGATEVTWEDIGDELELSDAIGQPIGLITDGTANQTLGRFSLTAFNVDSTVTEMRFTISVGSGVGDTLVLGDIATATLYEDANGNGQFDTGENFTGCLNVTIGGGGNVIFNVPNEVVTPGTPRIWSVAITFAIGADGHHGSISLACPSSNGLTLDVGDTAVVTGLPLAVDDIPVTGPVSQLVIITQPSAVQATVAISPAPVVELRDAAGNVVLGRSFNVTAAIQSGGTTGAVLSGTPTVASSVLTGRATFGNLRISLPGTGYVLRFSIAAPAANVDSNAFNVTAAPVLPPKKKSSGGGCAVDETGHGGWAALAALLAAMSLGVAARLRRES